jgi:hypothetical protein
VTAAGVAFIRKEKASRTWGRNWYFHREKVKKRMKSRKKNLAFIHFYYIFFNQLLNV